MITNILFKKWQKVYKKGLTKALPYGIIIIENKKRKEVNKNERGNLLRSK